MTTTRASFVIAGNEVRPGRKATLELPIARLMSGTPITLPVQVFHGRQDGPAVWLTAAVHGDELCGIEIIRRVSALLDARTIMGTVITVPIVNVHGFNTGERTLPDGRDLNRSFPGTARGSLTSRVAHLMMSEIISRCDVGIDLHTGSAHRTNYPQIRANLDDPDTMKLAHAFGAPIAIHAETRDGSLRQAATEAGTTVLLYEGGEASRFESEAIAAGTAGVQRVLSTLGVAVTEVGPGPEPLWSRQTRWVRASMSGILHLEADLGGRVRRGDVIAAIFDPFGKRLGRMKAPTSGMVIGHTQYPLVNRGDAVVHVAELADRDDLGASAPEGQ